MQIKKKINNLNRLYIIFFSSVLFINIVLCTTLNANSFKITDLEISEPFVLNFNKEEVIDKGFKKAFSELVSTITTSDDKKKIKDVKLSTIKNLIDSFTMSNERFIKNIYKVNFDVSFNIKNTLSFFEKKNIFPSIPIQKKLLLIPVFVNLQSDQIQLFDKNIFYEQWNKKNKRYYLLNYILPSEDLEDINLILQNSESIEDYSFDRTIKKYDLEDYVIVIIYKNKNELRVLSKMQLNQSFKINNTKFKNVNFNENEDIDLVLERLKTIYENYWKEINQINTSIKLPITISVNSNKHKKIKIFENILDQLILVSNYEIVKFDSKKIYYKVVYNGPPDKFFENIKEKNLIAENINQIWEIK
jgi:hypothetical protein